MSGKSTRQAFMNESEESKYSLLKNDFFIKSVSGKYILTSILSMVFLYVGSLVDTLIVGAYLGEDGLSAMSLVGPVYLIYYTVGATLGIGASILGSRVLGQEQQTEYRKIFTCATLLLACACVLMTGLAYGFLSPVMRFLCRDVTGEQYEMARDYLIYYIPGGAMTMLSYIPLYFFRIEGKPKISSRLFTMSAIVNVILSWLFVGPLFNMGTGGAALATSISMGLVAIIGFLLLLGKKGSLRFTGGSLNGKRIRSIVTAGIPNGASNLLESARIYLINFLLIWIGASALLPCHTVVRNVLDLMYAVVIGLSGAFLPLVGVFFGERDYKSLREILRHAGKIGLRVIIPLTVVVCCLGDPLCRLFGMTDTELIREGRLAIPLTCLGLVFTYINTLNTNYLTAIKRETLATLLAALRLFVLLAAFAVPLAMSTGSLGIWLSFSLADLAAFLIYCLIRRLMRRRKPSLDRYLLDKEKEPVGDISFSVRNQAEDIVYASDKISLFCEDNEINMKKAMKVSLAIEEILTFLISHCLGEDTENYIDVRVSRLENEVMVRFRYVGKIYDPMAVYENNEKNEEMEDELLGLKIIARSAQLFRFQQTLGSNNLMIIF